MPVDGDQLIDQLRVLSRLDDRSDRVRRPALEEVGAEEGVALVRDAVRVIRGPHIRLNDRRGVWLRHHDLSVRRVLPEVASHAPERAARARRRDKVVEAQALHGLDNLWAGGLGVDPGVGLALELLDLEPSVLLREKVDGLEHPPALVRWVGQDDLGACTRARMGRRGAHAHADLMHTRNGLTHRRSQRALRSRRQVDGFASRAYRGDAGSSGALSRRTRT